LALVTESAFGARFLNNQRAFALPFYEVCCRQ
jgi:hypothetical protein